MVKFEDFYKPMSTEFNSRKSDKFALMQDFLKIIFWKKILIFSKNLNIKTFPTIKFC